MFVTSNKRLILIYVGVVISLAISVFVFMRARADEPVQEGGQPNSVYLPLIVGTTIDSTAEQAALDQDLTLVGEFLVIWGDPGPGSKTKKKDPTYILFDDQGQTTELELSNEIGKVAGGPMALVKKRVEVEGKVVGPKKVKVKKIKPDKSKQPNAAALETAESAVSGSQPWVTILCRFADSTGVTPQPQSYFQGLMGGIAPAMNHYFREDSFNTVNLNGSLVVGWYNLPSPRAAYLPGGNLDFSKALNDCTAAADAAVFFPNFVGINLIFNQDLDCCAWGGGGGVNRDGQTKSYFVTWMPPWGWGNQSVMAHEMGHGFGLPHSSGPYSETYDSQWDPMSSPWRCTPPHVTYGCVAPQTISYHKNRLVWVPPGDKYLVNASGSHNLTIAQLGTLASVNDYLMAEVPIGCTGQFYTVESRRFVGYDSYLPGEAVVIHHVDPTRGDRVAQVVDADGNGNPNDAGAMWLSGETFTDAANGISIAVTGATATGWTITINSPGGGDAYESDNSWEEARLFTVGGTETHGFCFSADQDWVYFSATAGFSYRLETLNLAAPTDTILCLYQNPTQPALICDDDGGGYPQSLINFTPTASGVYYVQAYQYGGGAAATYDLRMQIIDLIFADGFESGNLSAWSASANAASMSVTAEAALVGTRGLQMAITSNTTTYLTNDSPNAEARYRVRFYLDPNSLVMTHNDMFIPLYGYQGTTPAILRVDFRRYNNNYQVRSGLLLDSTTWKMTPYYTVSDAPHSIEIDWQAATAAGANNGSLTLWIDGVQRPMLSGIDNDTRRIDRARLGAYSVDTGTRGSFYLDDFVSHRENYIGPATALVTTADATDTVTDLAGSEAATALPVVTTALVPGVAASLTGALDGPTVTVATTPATVQTSGSLVLTAIDDDTLPAGYRRIGHAVDIGFVMTDGAPFPALTDVYTVTIAYPELDAMMSLQAWNSALGLWEVVPTIYNAENQTLQATLQQPTRLALMQAEPKEEYIEYQLHLPLIQH